MGKSTKNYCLEEVPENSKKLICKECSRETSHNIIASYSENGSEDCGGGNYVDWYEINQIIQCLGCETVSFRIVSTSSEDVDYDNEGNRYYNEVVKYYPGRSEVNIRLTILPNYAKDLATPLCGVAFLQALCAKFFWRRAPKAALHRRAV